MPFQRAARDLLNDAVVRQVFLRALHELFELRRIVVRGIPLVVLVRVNGSATELIMIDDNSRVAVERQALGIGRALVGREIEPRVAGRQDGRDGLPRHGQHLAVGRLTDRLMAGQQHEVGALGERDEVIRRQRDVVASRAPHAGEPGRIEDVAVFVGVHRRDEIVCIRLAHASPSPAFVSVACASAAAGAPACGCVPCAGFCFFCFFGLYLFIAMSTSSITIHSTAGMR